MAITEAGYSQLQAPAGALVFHAPTRSVRVVHGIPGSAFVGEALLGNLNFASISPSGYAAVVTRGETTGIVTGLDKREPNELVPEKLISHVDRVAWNASGDVLVLCSSTDKLVQQVKLIDGEARPGAPVNLSAQEGSISTLAVDSSGERIAVGIEHTPGGILLIRDGALSGPLVTMRSPVGAVYGADGSLYVVDRITTESLVLVDDVITQAVPLVEPGKDPIEVVGQAVSTDGRRLYVAAKTGSRLYVFDLHSRRLLSATQLEKPPDSLTLMQQSLLLLNSARAKSDPLWVMTDQETPVIRFIPVVGEDADSL
jgi:DNA-binding beta-propeller fold protein YncE